MAILPSPRLIYNSKLSSHKFNGNLHLEVSNELVGIELFVSRLKDISVELIDDILILLLLILVDVVDFKYR